MTLPIYLSDASGRKGRSQADYDYITKFMHNTVVDMVEAAGYTAVKNAVPDMLPKRASLEGYGGLVLFGGYDVDSSFYEKSSHWRYSRGVNKTDEFELELIFEAIRLGLPVLGICRGMQLINVAHGGTLHHDIGHLTKLSHNNFGAGAYEHRAVAHPVEVVGSSVLADGNYVVASSHHQAVDGVGEELIVTGMGHDGIIEMVENPERNIIGVQWHPEASHVKQSDTISPLIQAFLSVVPETVVETAQEALPKFHTVESLTSRFPAPEKREVSTYSKPYTSRYESEGRASYESMYGKPMALFDANDGIIDRHFFLDEDDYTLQDDFEAEIREHGRPDHQGVSAYLQESASMMERWDELEFEDMTDEEIEQEALAFERRLSQEQKIRAWS